MMHQLWGWLQGRRAVFKAPTQPLVSGRASVTTLRLGRGATFARDCTMPVAHLRRQPGDGALLGPGTPPRPRAPP